MFWRCCKDGWTGRWASSLGHRRSPFKQFIASRTTLGRLWIWLLNERILTDEDCRVRRWCKVVGQLHLPIVYTSTGEGKHSRTVYSSSWLQKMFFQTFTWFAICSCPSLTFLRSERSEGPGLTFFFFRAPPESAGIRRFLTFTDSRRIISRAK